MDGGYPSRVLELGRIVLTGLQLTGTFFLVSTQVLFFFGGGGGPPACLPACSHLRLRLHPLSLWICRAACLQSSTPVAAPPELMAMSEEIEVLRAQLDETQVQVEVSHGGAEGTAG